MLNGIYNILLFDESNADIILLRECFRDLDFKNTITVLKSKQNLNEMLSTDRYFDFIISEYRIPDLTAPEILKIIKNTKLSEIPFIILTSDQYPGTLNLCRESGADLVLSKPSDYSNYLVTVKTILHKISESENSQFNLPNAS